MEKKAYLYIILGASFWGIIGIFIQGLYHFGFTSMEIVALRVSTAAVLLVGYVYFKDKRLLKVRINDLPYFIGTGVFSITFFSWCYFTAIKLTSLSVAVIFLYTAPIFVAILSRIFFRELLTREKITAIGLTFIGIILIVGFNKVGTISSTGILVGLGSGLGYALYSIFGKAALKKYNTLTITTYSFVFAGIFMIPVSRLWTRSHLFSGPQVWFYILGLGLVPTVLAYIFYTNGLSYIESSKAAIIASIEPVVAVTVGVVVYNEVLTIRQIIGICFVLTAIVLVNKKRKRSKERA